MKTYGQTTFSGSGKTVFYAARSFLVKNRAGFDNTVHFCAYITTFFGGGPSMM